MPLYEYHCTNCGTQFEKRVALAQADRNPQCPECSSAQTRKKLSTFTSFGSQSSPSSAGTTSCAGAGRFT